MQRILKGKAETDTISSFHKWRNLSLLVVAQVLAMGLWFSASAVVPQLTVEWSLNGAQRSWLTISVQIGFVIGALFSAILNLADRVPAPRMIAVSALGGALVNAAVPLINTGPAVTIFFRMLTGMFIAGVYPPGMKLAATWCKADRGLGIGLLVSGTVLGNAVPQLLNVFSFSGTSGMPDWRTVMLATSVLAIVASLLSACLVKAGPFLSRLAPFNWRFTGRILSHQPTRLANFGYLGHMWELYGMWTWVPLFLIAAYTASGLSLQAARLAGFGAIAMGAIGSLLAGKLADRYGRTAITTFCLMISGACALTVGIFFSNPIVLTILCLLWGTTVVADSAQFSTAVSELTDARYVGTALTLQTCLGFLLTTITIRIIPPLVEFIGWEYGFSILALGPVFGIWSMLRLRRLPESKRMASGHR